jgi:hypothetical protein
LDGYHVNSLAEVLAIQTQRTLEAFNLRGETSLQYGHPAPLFDPWTGGLLAVGALGILLPFGGHQRVLLALWVWMSLLIGSILTIDALFSPREVVVIPALVLVSALTLEYAWRGMSNVFGRAGTWAFTLPAVALIGLACQANVHDYFDIQIVQRVPAGRFTLLSRYVQATNDRYQAYIIGRADYTFAYDTPRFLVPGADVVNVRDQPLALPLEHIPPDKGVAFFVESSDDNGQRLIGIRSTYPYGREETIFERPGHPAFISYLVENSDLIAASPATAHD